VHKISGYNCEKRSGIASATPDLFLLGLILAGIHAVKSFGGGSVPDIDGIPPSIQGVSASFEANEDISRSFSS